MREEASRNSYLGDTAPEFEIGGPNFLVVHPRGSRRPCNYAEVRVKDAFIALLYWRVTNPLPFFLWAVKTVGVWPVVRFIEELSVRHLRGELRNPGAYLRTCLNRPASVERLKKLYGDIPRRYLRPALRWMQKRWQRLSARFKDAWTRGWLDSGWEYLRAAGVGRSRIQEMLMLKFLHPLDAPSG